MYFELCDVVLCNEYFGLFLFGIVCFVVVMLFEWYVDFCDDCVEDVGFDDLFDVVVILCFMLVGVCVMELVDCFCVVGLKVVMGGFFLIMCFDEVGVYCDVVVIGEGEVVWFEVLCDVVFGVF